jgi:hypothetical protein
MTKLSVGPPGPHFERRIMLPPGRCGLLDDFLNGTPTGLTNYQIQY